MHLASARAARKSLILACGFLLLGAPGYGRTDGRSSQLSLARIEATHTTFGLTLFSIRWIAYAPTNWNPVKGIQPSEASLRADLKTLHDAGFTGLVTYGADLPAIPRLASECGFRGMLLGVWDPKDPVELALAGREASNPLILGFIVGNEGLGERYDLDTLQHTVKALSDATGKPVTTSEQVNDYQDQRLLSLGDWICPNAHPFWNGRLEPHEAVRWTVEQYQSLLRRTVKPVLLKEVGLPSAGHARVSEAAQSDYYRLLMQTDVRFCFFEAYDQPWKQWSPVEPHWGLFRADRSAKPVVFLLR
jgi:exo-beta-1,3-glucanase (GH17 family)